MNRLSQTLICSAILTPMLLLSGCGGDSQSAMVQDLKVNKIKAPDLDENTVSTGKVTLTPEQLKELSLTTAVVEQHKVPKEVLLTGQVEANSNLTTPVISLVPGRIEQVFCQQGDIVKKDQRLAFVRSDEIAQIEAALLKDVLDFDADMQQARVQSDLAEKVYSRHTQLFKEGISARADLENAESAYEKAKVELRTLIEKRSAVITSVRERLRLYGVDKDELDRVLTTKKIDDDFYLEAPRAGIITVRNIDVGQLVDNVKELFVVTDLKQVWLTAQAFEKDIHYIKTGQPVKVTVNSYPEREFHGKVDYTGAILDSDTRTMPVRATVQNQDIVLKPEMFANIRVVIGQTEALSIPMEAVRKTGEASVAYVVHGPAQFEERKIEVGRKLGPKLEVLKGLKRGEVVVVRGSLQLQGQILKQIER
jgi:membrane fusion protein, heavy metal efflux system